LIVIDASAAIALLLNEDHLLAGSEQLTTLVGETVIAPSHWAAEVGNALVINVRRHRLDPAALEQMIVRLEMLGIHIEPAPSFSEIAILARQSIECGLTYYDAAYVEIARARRASLFTFDRKMRAAASRLNVPLLPAEP
jgi:predicted nucleic acid-binding protein